MYLGTKIHFCWRALLVTVIALIVCLLPTIEAVAKTDYNEVCVRGYDCALYDPPCTTTDDSASASSGTGGGPVYMMGDSITAGAKADLMQEFAADNVDVSRIDGVVSRSFVSRGEGETNGLEAIEADKDRIATTPTGKSVNTVIIALGTNGEDANGKSSTFKKNAESAITKIKAINGTAKIYWVNIATDSARIAHKGDYNKVIEGLAGVSLINADKAVPKISLSGDDVHPDPAGYKTFAKLVTGTIARDAKATPTDATGNGDLSINGPFKSGPPPIDVKVDVGDAYKGPGSTYGLDPVTGYVDSGATGQTASGISLAKPGIAVYTHSSLKGYWKVAAPNGKIAILQQTDIGPSASGSRGRRIVDVNSVAVRSVFGLKQGNSFPTDQGDWKIEYMGKDKPAGAITEDSGGKGNAAASAADPAAPAAEASTCCVTADGTTTSNTTAGATSSSKPTKSVAAFVDKYGQGAYDGSLTDGVPYDFTLAQAILESGFGESELSAKYFNFFGIKAGGNWKGPTVNFLSNEAGGARRSDFRVYKNAAEGFKAHGQFFHENSRYKEAFKYSNDSKKFLQAIKDAGYATDPNYVAKVSGFIDQVQAYVASKNLFPPSSQVTYTISAGDSGTADTADPASNACCPPDSLGSGASTTGKPDFIDLSGPPVNGIGMGNGPFSQKLDTLVIHYTQGNQEGASLRTDVFGSSGNGIHFNVGKTGKVYNYMPLSAMQKAGHVKALNGHSIGIEITGEDGNALLHNETQFKAVVQTATYLCDLYNIPCGQPKGDFTNSSVKEAQGMIGHDEAPGNDHSDPDTAISSVGGREAATNITTGKPWTETDRKDTGTHAYMLKLRAAMGFDPAPGSSRGTSTATPATPDAACPGANHSADGTSDGDLVWPFATKNESQYNRIDQGWDIQDKAGANIYAIASGTIHKFAPDTGNFGNDYPTQELDKDIGGTSKWVYYGHIHMIASLNNKHVKAGQLIGHANKSHGENGSGAPPGWLEIGFAKPNTDAPTDSCGGVPACAGVETAAGKKMKALLLKTKPGSGGD